MLSDHPNIGGKKPKLLPGHLLREIKLISSIVSDSSVLLKHPILYWKVFLSNLSKISSWGYCLLILKPGFTKPRDFYHVLWSFPTSTKTLDEQVSEQFLPVKFAVITFCNKIWFLCLLNSYWIENDPLSYQRTMLCMPAVMHLKNLLHFFNHYCLITLVNTWAA